VSTIYFIYHIQEQLKKYHRDSRDKKRELLLLINIIKDLYNDEYNTLYKFQSF
jgi:hypothetical protein